MTVLVTGASGFLGTAVVGGLLANREPHVRCFVRPSSHIGPVESLRLQYPHSVLEYVTGNLVSSTDVSRALDGVGLNFLRELG
jgi:thioester reductase-like protein